MTTSSSECQCQKRLQVHAEDQRHVHDATDASDDTDGFNLMHEMTSGVSRQNLCDMHVDGTCMMCIDVDGCKNTLALMVMTNNKSHCSIQCCKAHSLLSLLLDCETCVLACTTCESCSVCLGMTWRQEALS